MIPESLSGLGYSLGWNTAKALPERVAYQAFSSLADQTWLRHGRSVQRLESNLARVCPELTTVELRRLSRQGMRSYMRYWCDTFRLPTWSRERLLSRVSVIGEEHLRSSMEAGNGCVVTLPHSGNWDHAGAWATLSGWHLLTVAERLEPESLFNKFLEYRTSLGMEILPSDGGPRVLARLASGLREGHLVALVADRDLSKSGIEVKFFGEAARMPAGPAALSVQTGAPLVPATVAYTETGIEITFGEPIPAPEDLSRAEMIQTMTQSAAWFFEDGIRQNPQDWHMLQRIWTVDL
jgi:phosphatidylinositol dimannoside acyltransferase